jgi:hypothetical protein
MSLTSRAGIRQGTLGRIAARLPTYLSDIRENPAWLPMFIFARTLPGRRLHWRFAKPAGTKGLRDRPSLFGNIHARDAVAALQADGIFDRLMLPASVTEEIVRFAR